MKKRLDQELAARGLVFTRSQAESYIKLGQVKVNGETVNKSGYMVSSDDRLAITTKTQYVSRAALKLESVAKSLELNFKEKIVMDVGSSTGGFTDYALKNGAKKVIAVEVGTNQMHPTLKNNPKVELHEKTDIRDFVRSSEGVYLGIHLVVIDVSFVSLRDILPFVAKMISENTWVVAMAKPQFEAINSGQKHKGVIKNDKIRRKILKDFESWTQNLFKIVSKEDSLITGQKGNKERFYLLKLLNK